MLGCDVAFLNAAMLYSLLKRLWARLLSLVQKKLHLHSVL